MSETCFLMLKYRARKKMMNNQHCRQQVPNGLYHHTKNEHQIITLSMKKKISLNLRQCKVGRSYRNCKALPAIRNQMRTRGTSGQCGVPNSEKSPSNGTKRCFTQTWGSREEEDLIYTEVALWEACCLFLFEMTLAGVYPCWDESWMCLINTWDGTMEGGVSFTVKSVLDWPLLQNICGSKEQNRAKKSESPEFFY